MIVLDIEPANLVVPKSAKGKDKYKNANLYQACEDAFAANAVLDEKALLRSRYHSVIKDGKTTRVLLDRGAPDFTNMFLESGTPVAPDEILETLKPLTLKIPIKYREDFAADQLPLAELLSAIQYYASHLDIPKNSMDETALLAFGVLAESWADEMVTDQVAEMFLETSGADQVFDPSSDSEVEESLGNEVVCWSDEESDIMSIEMEDSDTDEENLPAKDRARTVSSSSSASSSDFESSSGFSDSSSDGSSRKSTSDEEPSSPGDNFPRSSPSRELAISSLLEKGPETGLGSSQ